MEKVEETPDTPEVFKNDIELYLAQFCEEYKIEDMTKEPQSRWNAALMYINRYVFSDKSILKLNKNINKNNTNCIINIFWISLEFKVTGAQLYRRFKYGDNGWTEWIEF